MSNHYDTIILGGGPAGLTAGIYLSRARHSVLIIDNGTIGGQTVLTHQVANYPGLTDVAGYQLAMNMRAQAENFGCKIVSNAIITDTNIEDELKTVSLDDGSKYTSSTVIIATGGVPRSLGIESEEIFKSRGISYCATCDGDFFTGKEIVVIGGGNSALEEAVSLTKYASKVTILHQFDHFQALPHYTEEAKNNDKIHFVMDIEVVDFLGDQKLEKVIVRKNDTKELLEFAADGAFVFIGYVPNTSAFQSVLNLNDRGEILTDTDLKTNVDGVWAAGDVRAKKYRQITTAVADGTVAALSAIERLALNRVAV